MTLKVCKFGCTSMADGNTMQAVKKIIDSDVKRKYVVVSAPGKRFNGDVKVTDLLYACYGELKEKGDCSQSFAKVRARFESIVKELNLSMDIKAVLDETQRRLNEEQSEDFTASRGEYLSARIMAELLGVKFIDGEDVVFFKEDGRLDGEKTYRAISQAVADGANAVFPGFYGRGAD